MSDTLNLLANVHLELNSPAKGLNYLVKGNYKYYHYLCDGLDDRGWGCGYRTLQTLCSWVCNRINNNVQVPNIPTIQQTLITIEDKPHSFLGSTNWIGTVEAMMVLDSLYDVQCKIKHINSGSDLLSVIPDLVEHFKNKGSPIMMGGDTDCSSKGIVGIHTFGSANYLLIVDPHYYGVTLDLTSLQSRGWIKWVAVDDFLDNSFYNLCLPQLCST